MKNKILTIVAGVVAVVLLIGISVSCKKKSDTILVDPEVNTSIVTDVLGKEYVLVSEEKKLEDGTTIIETWKRIKPLDNDRLYVKVLSSKMNTNDVPIFTAIMK